MQPEMDPYKRTVIREQSVLRTGKIASLCSIISLLALTGQAQTAATPAPAAPAAPAVAAGAEVKPDETVVLEEFVTTGIRGSAIKAIEVKRNSPQMLEAIVSEDIGKFPDNNVVESLQRVSGIQVTDFGAGQISTVTIRGLNDVTTTLNGRNIFTASGTAFSLPDMPASLLKEVDVKKTRAASDIESGIAGVIDIHTFRPFDFSGMKTTLAVKGTYTQQSEKYDPNVSALFSDRWKVGTEGKFGALLNVSYLTQSYRDQSITPGAEVPFVGATPPAGWVPYQRIFTDGTTPWVAGLDAGLPHAAGSTMLINGVATPYVLSRDAIFQADTPGKTKRPAANLSLQFSPNDKAEYTFEVFYDGYRNESRNNLLFSFVDWWGGPYSNPAVTLYPGTNIVHTRDLVSYVYTFTSGEQATAKTDSIQYALNAKWKITPDFTLNSQAYFQNSVYNQTFFAVRADGVRNISVNFNAGDGVPAFRFPGSDITQASQWNLGHAWDQAHKNQGSASTLTEDGVLNVDWGAIKRLKFGVYYDDRKASQAQRLQEGDPIVGGSLALHPEMVDVNHDFFENRADTPRSWASVSGSYIGNNADKIRSLYGMQTSDKFHLTQTFNVNEITAAAYAEVDELKADIAGHKLTAQFGVRVVDIKTLMNFTNTTTLNQTSGVAGVTKVLPSGIVQYEITKNLIGRLAYGETIRRPGFGDLNPVITYTRDVTNIGYGTASGGNPNLKPTKSKNFDVSVEYYFDEASAVNVALFKRKIDGLVVPFRKTVTYTDSIGAYNYILSAPDNASNGDLQGIEVGGKYFPKNLPSILQGFGIDASYTHLKSSQDVPITNGAGKVIGTYNTQFYAVSPDSFNVTLAYERSKFSARLAYAWRSAFFHNPEAAAFANPLYIYDSAQRSVNMQIGYKVTDDLVVSIEGTNLTNDIQHSYYGEDGSTTNNFGNWIAGRTISVSARYSF